MCHRAEPNCYKWSSKFTNSIVPFGFSLESFVIIVKIDYSFLFVGVKFFGIEKNSVLSIRKRESFSANVVMSTASVPSRVGSPFPQKKKTMKLFYHLLSDMKHQRVAVIALALGQAVNIDFIFIQMKLFLSFTLFTPDKRLKIFFYRFFQNERFLLTPIGIGAFCIIFGMSWFDSCKTNITIIVGRSFGSKRT